MRFTYKRATLQLMTLDDDEALYNIVETHPKIWTYLIAKMNQPSDMSNYISSALSDYERGAALPFTVIDQATQSIVGSTRLYNLSKEQRTVELGHTWYHPKVQRTSINTECKLMLLHYAFETLEVIRVQIKTDLRNSTAQKAIERLGATKEGILRNERQLPNGYIRDAVVYSLLDREWPDVKRRLEKKLEKKHS
ncbi:N-acetyltransferase [Pullulanibacillus camelliae]|uniref:N-acetyltransferase n=1 Tax=Pullulanibacillus camelliae TaxID=1707096 RepID=A0A8J2YHP4_9BACL|nr:GNAT family protein [Pullulanibacillus camelliae]GGE43577.1 N-acetyltransferase [Pullulanibacillus camelliae]